MSTTNALTNAEYRRLRSEWPLLEDANEQGLSGVHVALVVIRHIYSFLKDDDIPNYRMESIVIRAARMFFSKDDPALYPKALFLKSMALGVMLTTHDPPAIDVFRSDPLTDLWSRDIFHLWQRKDLTRPIGKRGEWQEADGTDLKDMVNGSLVEYNGETTLDECINREFGMFDNRATGWRWFRLPKLQTFMRVHYQPGKGKPRSFQELHTFTVKAKTLGSNDPASRTFPIVVVEQKYTIIAAVRLRKAPGEKDIVLTYDEDGTYIPHPEDATSIVDDTARLGEGGYEWLLFYAKSSLAKPSHIPKERFEEVVPLDPVIGRNLSPLNPGSMGTGDATAPYPFTIGGQQLPLQDVMSRKAAAPEKTPSDSEGESPLSPEEQSLLQAEADNPFKKPFSTFSLPGTKSKFAKDHLPLSKNAPVAGPSTKRHRDEKTPVRRQECPQPQMAPAVSGSSRPLQILTIQ